MAAKDAAGSGQGATRSLPPIKVAKFKDAADLIERIVHEKVSVFGANIKKYRDERFASSERRLDATETAQVAAALGWAVEDEPEKAAEMLAKIQNSDLRASDPVPQTEVLVAAGLATAPALLDAVSQLVALIEMDNEVHKKAREDGKLTEAIEAGVQSLDDVDLEEARTRASAALEHFQSAAGATAGEGWSLILNLVTQALGQAIQADPSFTSTDASLTGSPPSTDGAETSASTA